MYEHVKPGRKHIPPSEQPLQFQSDYYFNKPRIPRLDDGAEEVGNLNCFVCGEGRNLKCPPSVKG